MFVGRVINIGAGEGQLIGLTSALVSFVTQQAVLIYTSTGVLTYRDTGVSASTGAGVVVAGNVLHAIGIGETATRVTVLTHGQEVTTTTAVSLGTPANYGVGISQLPAGGNHRLSSVVWAAYFWNIALPTNLAHWLLSEPFEFWDAPVARTIFDLSISTPAPGSTSASYPRRRRGRI